jgi:hypothetical protein
VGVESADIALDVGDEPCLEGLLSISAGEDS